MATLIVATMSITNAYAKREQVPHVYVFGMAASFNDSIVFFTDIQTLAGAWVDTKSGFLQSRDQYAYQLREYLAQKLQQEHRTCIIFYNQKRDKLEKKYQKLRRLYTNPKPGSQQFDVRYINDGNFRFEVIDLTDEIAMEEEQAREAEAHMKEIKKARKAQKHQKRDDKE